MKSKSQRIFIYICIVSMLILSSHSTCTDYTIGALCSKSCQAPGVVLDDEASCFCDPNKFVVHSDTMTCERKLRLGYYPVLKNKANSGVTDDKYAHVLETACNSACRTCQFTNDFSTGTSDYCTSCDPTTLPILDLGATKPTCVADIPAKRAMVVIQNNQILGVNNQATKYGGSNSDGTRTTQSQTDPNQNLQSSTTSSTTSTMNTSGGVNSSTTQSNNQVLMSVGMEANLPKVMDIINSMGVLGIGAMKDDGNSCAASMIDKRLPLDYQPGIVMLAVACPTDCDECAVTQNGNLACTKAASAKFLQDGMVVASCPTDGYLTDGNNCLKCSKNGNGCKTCSKATIGGMSVLQCSACFTELGYALEDQAITGGTLKVCNQKQCLTDKSKYWNGSACVACTADCNVCDDAKCAFCGKDKSNSL